jgi:hypothetical protein
VWLDTLGDGLIRADAIIGIRTHPTPVIAGKLSHWLLDVVLAATTGSGVTDRRPRWCRLGRSCDVPRRVGFHRGRGSRGSKEARA